MSQRNVMPLLLVLLFVSPAAADQPKKLLLLGQNRDHPPKSHEYVPGLEVLSKCLGSTADFELQIIKADEPCPEVPELLGKADGIVLFLGQGGRWIQNDPKRLEAIQALAARGGAIVALHWAIGAKDAKYIEPHRSLIGGVHGGPDRKYIFTEAPVRVVARQHPISSGLEDSRLKDEFYYRLKFTDKGTVTPILQVPIEGNPETVAWAYERPDGGRSFGFSGMHYHANWGLTNCNRMVVQAVFWTLGMPIPKEGLAVEVTEEDLKLPQIP